MSSVTQNTLVSAMWRMLEITEADMNTKFPESTMLNGVAKPVTRSTSKYQQYFDTLNHISYAIHRVVKKDADPIQFFHCRNVVLEFHPLGTVNCPDFFAQRATRGKKPSVFHWSTLEATGEFFPGKKRKKQEREAIYETASYTSHFLEARPDRLAVQGMCIEPEGFKLNLSNACGSFYTKVLDWESRPSRLLLAAWIWRLYHPFVDPSITTKFELKKAPKYTIHCPDELYEDCGILSVGSGFGRRTVVFKTAKPNTIIKEQYLRLSSRSEETENLSKVHSKGSFPGVVRLGWNGPVTANQQELVVKCEDVEEGKVQERKKMRMVLLDEGGSLMDVETLRDALIAMYDLLEITRFLHTHRKIFHRDISSRNVLLRKAFPTADARYPLQATDLQSTCFASHLLNAKSADSSANRLDTRVLLIDFDTSEDQERGRDGARAGTHIFMAREVRSGGQCGGRFLRRMPQLGAGQNVYNETVGDRLKAFPPNETEWNPGKEDTLIEPFVHLLRYEAESVFWLLLWWAVQAQPMGDDHTEGSQIDSIFWLLLKGESDSWMPGFKQNHFHPFYKPLGDLFHLMAEQLGGCLEKCKEPSRKKDEYLHEALQRIIFDFLFDHYDDSFMTAKKNPKSRTVIPIQLYYGFGRQSASSSGGDSDDDGDSSNDRDADGGEDVGHDKKRRRIN